MTYLPSTSDFPPDPAVLERSELNSIYLELRSSYASSMRSRAQHRRFSDKAKQETALLRARLEDLARREGSVRKDIYEILEIVTAIAGDIEDAGDDLVNEFGRYKLGRKTYQGGSYLGGLVQAVIRFINRWTQTKDKVVLLGQKRQDFLERTKRYAPLASANPSQQDAPEQSTVEVSAHGADR